MFQQITFDSSRRLKATHPVYKSVIEVHALLFDLALTILLWAT